MKQSVYRILDANYNRAKEALRVAEDITRFISEDRNLTRRLKKCRHEMTQVILTFPRGYRNFVSARDSETDVGRNHVITDRRSRVSLGDILTANFKRGQESLRVLEEVSKVISSKHSEAFKKLRFGLYELEKKAVRKF